MDPLEQLNASAAALLQKAQQGTVTELAAAVEKATGVQKLAADLDLSKSELRKLALEEKKLEYEISSFKSRERSDRWKDRVAVLAPFVTVVTLAATLMFQSWQFRQVEAGKRADSQAAQWQAAVKSLTEETKLSAGAIALRPFLDSREYGEQARETVVRLLATTRDTNLFDDLFESTFVPLRWSNVDYLIKLDRALAAKCGAVWGKAFISDTAPEDTSKLSKDEAALLGYCGVAVQRISQQVGPVLRTPRPSSDVIDLTATRFYDASWDGVDLGGANIQNIYFSWVSLEGANFSGISQFGGIYIFHSAWWRAARMSPELLQYLEKTYPWAEGAQYGPNSVTYTQQQYSADLARLGVKQ